MRTTPRRDISAPPGPISIISAIQSRLSYRRLFKPATKKRINREAINVFPIAIILWWTVERWIGNFSSVPRMSDRSIDRFDSIRFDSIDDAPPFFFNSFFFQGEGKMGINGGWNLIFEHGVIISRGRGCGTLLMESVFTVDWKIGNDFFFFFLFRFISRGRL